MSVILGKPNKNGSDNCFIEMERKEIVNLNLVVKALIQDIQTCAGPREVLNEMNSEGRGKIAALRKHIDRLEILAKEQDTENTKSQLLAEVENYRQQLTSTLSAFRKANVACILNIEKSNKQELFDIIMDEANLRHRQRKDKEGLVKMSSDVTEQLRSISRHLSETTQRSADTLGTLVTSSNAVDSAQEEMNTMGSVISQSGPQIYFQ
ncbi:Vesicle transport protein SEC20 [Gryllus bimaculatus]|nr:Vesicle transport protein SEC20 [Gryllus bimaculatus]